jgi:signal transduction histidine kinase
MSETGTCAPADDLGGAFGEIARLEHEVQQEGRFVSDVSHELRSPIAGLRARLEEAQLYPDETSLRDVLDRALGDVNRLEAIVADLLQLARMNAIPRTAVENVDLPEFVLAEVARRTDPLTYQLRLQPGVTVDADRSQLRRVITNLLDNAQRHAEQIVDIEVRGDGADAELIVADDGAGIAEHDRERIFERFVRLPAGRSRDVNGTGLGLAISREIAHAHSGTLEVGDSPAGGARFTLRLPLT